MSGRFFGSNEFEMNVASGKCLATIETRLFGSLILLECTGVAAYSVRYERVGDEPDHYKPLTVTFTASGAQLNNLLDAMTITFTAATTMAHAGLCGLSLFSVTSLSKIGVAQCAWPTSTQLVVTFGFGASIVPGDSISFGSGILAAADGTSAVSGTVTLVTAASPPTPVVTINSFSKIGSCSAFTMDAQATGSGSRAFSTVTWSVQSTDGNFITRTAVNTFLLAQNALKLMSMPILGTLLLDSGASQNVWTFGLTVTNFLGASSALTTSTITIVGGVAAPSLRIFGLSTQTVNPVLPYTLFGNVVPASCALSSSTISYSWAVTTGATSISLPYSTALVLVIPANSLTAGTSYTATLTVTYTISGTASTSTATTTLSAQAAAPLLYLNAADFSFPLSTAFSLNILSAVSTVTGATFSWACYDVTNSQTCTQTITTSTALLSFTPSTAGFVAGASYRFTLTATLGGLSTSTSSTVTFVAVSQGSTVPGCTIQPVVNARPEKTINVMGSCTGAASFAWTVDSGALTLTAGTNVVSTTLPSLNFLANKLQPGASYTLRLTGTSSTGSSTSATVSFTVNQSPSGGTITPSATTGTALSTAFTFSATNWASSTALTYEFYYTTAAGLRFNMGFGATPSNQVTNVLLPPGTLTCGVTVRDTAGNEGTATVDVTVSTPSFSSVTDFLGTFADSTLTLIRNANDLIGSQQALSSAAALLNGAASTTFTLASAITQRTTLLTTLSTVVGGQVLSVLNSADIQQNFQSLQVILGDVATQVSSQMAADSVQLLTTFISNAETVVGGLTTTTATTAMKSISALLAAQTAGTVLASTVQVQLTNAVNNIAKNTLAVLACGEQAASLTATGISIIAQKTYATALAGNAIAAGNIAFTLPQSLATALSTTADTCMGMQSQVFSTNPFQFASNAAALLSSVSSLSFQTAAGVAMDTSNLAGQWVNLTLTLTSAPATGVNPVILYFSTVRNAFISTGCTVNSVIGTQVSGSCTHLTSFAAGPDPGNSEGLSTLIIAIIAASAGGGVLGIIGLIVICMCCCRGKTTATAPHSTPKVKEGYAAPKEPSFEKADEVTHVEMIARDPQQFEP
eukprot:TRINITY_DN1967_c0_g2_i1.p1 TRINITY_DN1967_c0_g2~~TRINITY_DN1967_c0_g2_i1.p1  ORF type:complete len:1090 (+),score=324.77 TRINITY_DN1967_c0_g2_i1:349-3618(+)